MADNVVANSGTGGATFAADDILGVHYPRTKLVIGADGTNDGDVSSANPLPVTNAGLTALNGAISGTEVQADIVSSALPTGASTSANQTTLIGHVDGIETLLGGGLPAALAAGGGLKVEGIAGGVAVPVSLASVPSHAVTNAGTFATQVDGSALTALQKIDDPVLVDDAAFTPATSSVSMAGFQADESATDSVDEGDAGAARMTLDRKVITTPQPHTSGGLLTFRSIDLDETEEEVKASAGQVYSAVITNTSTGTRFVKFYNATAANVTVGTTTPVITIGVPGNATDDTAMVWNPPMGIVFDTAITVAATTAVADADTGAPGANDVIINVFYK
jgi:hypothetical protein